MNFKRIIIALLLSIGLFIGSIDLGMAKSACKGLSIGACKKKSGCRWQKSYKRKGKSVKAHCKKGKSKSKQDKKQNKKKKSKKGKKKKS